MVSEDFLFSHDKLKQVIGKNTDTALVELMLTTVGGVFFGRHVSLPLTF